MRYFGNRHINKNIIACLYLLQQTVRGRKCEKNTLLHADCPKTQIDLDKGQQ